MSITSPLTPATPDGTVARIASGLRRVGAAVAASEAAFRDRPLTASVLVVATLTVPFFAVFTPGYQTNDDAWMAMIAAGQGVSLSPDEHLVYSNVVVGKALRALYTAVPSVPWYGCHLYLAQIAAHIALLYSTLSLGFTRRGLALCAVYFATAGVFLLNNLQFTSTAFLTVQAGALLCVSALLRRARDPGASIAGPLVCGVLMLVWGALIRSDGYYLVLLCVAAPVCIVLAGRSTACVVRPGIAAVGVSLAMVASFAVYNDAYYRRDPQWQAFYEYNPQRLKFNDYCWTFYDSETAPVFDAADWSENDHAMIAHWFFDDSERYSAERLRRVLDGYPWRVERLTTAYFAASAREIARDKTAWIIVLALPAFAWGLRGNRRALSVVLASVAVSLVLLCALAVFTKPPPSRIYIPVLAFPLAFALVVSGARLTGPTSTTASSSSTVIVPSPGSRRLETRRRFLALATTALAIVAVSMGLSRQWRQSSRTIAARAELARYIDDIAPRPDRLYVAWASSFPFEAISPFDNLQSFSPFRMLALSWPQTTPLAKQMKRSFEIDDLARALYERPDVLLIAQRPLLPLYVTYVQEHYGQTVEVARRETSRPTDAVTVRRSEGDGRRMAAREERTLPPVSWRIVR